MKLVFTNLTNLVALEQFHLKPTGVYGGGLLQLALGEKWASSLPLVQRISTALKNPWANFGAILISHGRLINWTNL